MTKDLGDNKERQTAAGTGCGIAFVTWPVPAFVLMAVTGPHFNIDGQLWLLVGTVFAWFVVPVIAAAVITNVRGLHYQGVRGGLITVGVALAAYLVFAVVVASV